MVMKIQKQNVRFYNEFLACTGSAEAELSLLRDKSNATSDMKPQTSDRGYDNKPLAQGYDTPRGAVIDGYGAVVEW
jgi:hypothetical protein